MVTINETLIVLKGAGDLASGVAYRLKKAGFPLVMTELLVPLFIRRTVAYGEAIYQGETVVDGITARRVDSTAEALRLAYTAKIPVLVDPNAQAIPVLQPTILIDAIMAKRNKGTFIEDAPFVVALGPGFTAGLDCHAIIETKRGHYLGRVITQGQAQPNSGSPGKVEGYSAERVLRAPVTGYVTPAVNIGLWVDKGDLLATMGQYEIHAPFQGVLRGLIHPSAKVIIGSKIGDLDPRGIIDHCYTISDKALAIGGGVVEAILSSAIFQQNNQQIR